MTGDPGMVRARGFVLLNALVLVAALAAIAVWLLAASEAGRARLAAGHDAAQASLYLDAMEALMETVLDRDRAQGAIDAGTEPWAQGAYDVEVDRGRATGTLADLQGRFNVNWLSNVQDTERRRAFTALCASLGVSSQIADAIAGLVAPGGPKDIAAYAGRDVPIRPAGGEITTLDALRAIPVLDAASFARLAPYLAALPGGTALNVNTAPRPVLTALLPTVGAVGLGRLVSQRRSAPFASVDDFLRRAAAVSSADALQTVDPARLTVASHWFQADISATLGEARLARTVVLHRVGGDGHAVVATRVTGR